MSILRDWPHAADKVARPPVGSRAFLGMDTFHRKLTVVWHKFVSKYGNSGKGHRGCTRTNWAFGSGRIDEVGPLSRGCSYFTFLIRACGAQRVSCAARLAGCRRPKASRAALAPRPETEKSQRL